MRKICIILLVLTFLCLFFGCVDKSVGVIGGADGPTAIFVTRQSK